MTTMRYTNMNKHNRFIILKALFTYLNVLEHGITNNYSYEAEQKRNALDRNNRIISEVVASLLEDNNE